MKRIALPLLALFIFHSAVIADFDFDAEKKSLMNLLADGHTDIGKEYKEAKLFIDARAHFTRATALVENYEAAMKALGMERSGAGWKEGKNPLPAKDGIAGNEWKAARDKIAKSRDTVYKRLASKIEGAAKRAKAAGKETEAKILQGYQFYYEPDNAAAREARGHVKVENDWAPKYFKAARDKGNEVLKAASEGEKITEEDPQGKEIGVRFWSRKGKLFIARATESDERAARLCRVLEATITLSDELLEAKGRFISKPPFYTVLTKQEDYIKMVEKFSKKEGKELELSRKLSGCGQKDPFGFFCWQNAWPGGDDMQSNTVSLHVLHVHRGGGSEAWVECGFGYLITSRLLGSTNTLRYTLPPDEGDTAVKGAEDMSLNKTGGGPAKLRAVALDLVQTGKDTPLQLLAATDLNALKLEQAAKSFAIIEWLFEKYPEVARKWLATKPGVKAAELANLEAAFGDKKTDAIDREWREWVLVTY